MTAIKPVRDRHQQAVATVRGCLCRRLVAGLGLAAFMIAPHANAQNVNDLLRIIIPPLTQQQPKPPPVYSPPPRVYSPPPAYTPAPQPYPQQRAPAPAPSVSRAEVQRTQQMLNDMGYDAGTPDGVAGPRTVAALNAFQRDNHLPVSSRLDKSTIATLAAIHRHTSTTAVASSAPASTVDNSAPSSAAVASAPAPGIATSGPVDSVGLATTVGSSAAPAQASTSGTDLRTLANPPAGMEPLTFDYFKGIPILSGASPLNVFELMHFAHEAPKIAKGEPSVLKKNECSLISRYFSDEAKEPYIRGLWGSSGCFLGKNEFELQDNYRNFYARNLATLQSFAPSAPFRLAVIHRASLQHYDSAKEQFTLSRDLAMGFNALSPRGQQHNALHLTLAGTPPEPVLPIGADAARELIEKVATWSYPDQQGKPTYTNTRDVNVVVVFDVLSADYETLHVATQLVSVGLYGPDLGEPIHAYTLAPDFGALARGAIPERLSFSSPPRLDIIFALAHQLSHSASNTVDVKWSWLFTYLQRRDEQFYANPPTGALPDNDVRLPVFPRGIGHFKPAYQPQLERWVAAYLAGLPDEVELVIDDLNPERWYSDRNNNVATLQAFGYDSLPKNAFAQAIQSNSLVTDQLGYRNINQINLLLAAPDQLSLYTVEVPRSALSDSKPPFRQTTLFRLKGIIPVIQDDKAADLILHLEPQRMVLESQEQVIARSDFSHVKDAAGRFVQVIQDTPQALPSNEALPLTPAVLDAMVLKALGNELAPTALNRATARRWQFEQATTPPFGNPFYIKGRRAPESHDLPKLAPQYKTWVASAVPDAPWQLKVALRGNSWRTIACTGSALELNNRQSLPGRTNEASAIRNQPDSDDHYQRNALLRERASTRLQIRPPAPGVRAATVSARTDQLKTLQMVEFALDVSDRYIEIGERCGLNGYVPDNPVLAAIYLHIEDGLPTHEEANENSRFPAEAVFEITGARVVPEEPHYTDLLPPDFVSARKLVRNDRNHQAIVLDAKLTEIVYFEIDRKGAKKEVGRMLPDPAQSIPNLASAAQAEPILDDGYQVPVGPYGWDIVGVQLGMTLDEAETIIRQHMDVGRVLEGKRAYDDEQKQGLPIAMTSGKLFVSRDQRELIALIDEPPHAAGKVLAVWRHAYMPMSTTPKDVLDTALREKYGDPTTHQQGGRYLWYTNGYHCPFEIRPRPLSEMWTENGKAVELAQSDGSPMMEAALPGPYYSPLNPEYEEKSASLCGPIMVAEARPYPAASPISTRNQPEPVDWLIEQTLTDIGAYTQAFKANRDAAYAQVEKSQTSVRPKF